MTTGSVTGFDGGTPTRLNLGCGAFKKPGYLNVDGNPAVEPDLLLDLDAFPYPFENGAFELIEADHVLEHLLDPFRVMKELHRTLRPGGRLVVRVPHFSRGLTHADHKRSFDVTFPFYFQPDFKGGYSGTEYLHNRSRLTWFAQPYLKRTMMSGFTFRGVSLAGKAIDAAANASPFFCSRIWCFWVGGFEEIEFEFRKPA